MNTVEKLERLGEIKKAIEKLKADETAEIQTILTPEIRAEIEKIGLKWAEKLAEFQSLKEQKVFLKITNEGNGMRAQLKCDNNDRALGNILFAAISAIIETGKAQGRSVADLINLIGNEYVRAMQCTGIDEDFKEFVASQEKCEETK